MIKIEAIDIISKLMSYKFVNFLFMGGIGVGLNLVITLVLTEFFLGRENYFISFIIGTLVNISYNFLAYSLITFKQKKISLNKKFLFYLYSIAIVILQLLSVKHITYLLGVNWYFVIMIFVIGIFSLVSFFFFNNYIFSKK